MVASTALPNMVRYVVCRGLRHGTEAVHNYLMFVNHQLHECSKKHKDHDILQVGLNLIVYSLILLSLQIVPQEYLQTEPFYSYVFDSNVR